MFAASGQFLTTTQLPTPTFDGDENVPVTESCPRQLGLVMQSQDAFVCAEVEAEISHVFSSKERNLTNTKVMTKGGMTIRKVRKKPANGNKPLNFDLSHLQ